MASCPWLMTSGDNPLVSSLPVKLDTDRMIAWLLVFGLGVFSYSVYLLLKEKWCEI